MRNCVVILARVLSPSGRRGAFGTRLRWEQGANLITVARLMGHENVTTTAIYAQATEDDLAQAVETFMVE